MEALSRTNVCEDRQYGNDKGKCMEKKQKGSGRDIAGFLLLGLSLIMLGRSVMLCFSNDIWYDELFTVGLAEHSYGELVRLTAADVHPPLYYCIVKFFVDLCKLIAPGVGTVIPAKLVSILPYFILLLYAVTLMRKRFGMFVGGMFLFCVTAMPQLSAYTVEVRMYGWAMLFVTAAFLHARALTENYVNSKNSSDKNGMDAAGGTETVVTETRRRQKLVRRFHGAALTFYGLAAAYTQYFACVAVVMVYVFLLLAFWFRDRRRIREWFLCVAVSVICYVPWLFALAGQLGAVSENYWILPLTWRSLGGCVKFLMKPAFLREWLNTVLAVVLFAAYLGLWCRWALKLYYDGRKKAATREKTGSSGYSEIGKNSESGEGKEGGMVSWTTDIACGMGQFALATAGVGVLAGLVAFGFAASFLIRPIFVYRYMIPAAGCFWLGFALCLNEILCKPMTGRSDKPGDGDANDELCKHKAVQSSGFSDGIAENELCKPQIPGAQPSGGKRGDTGRYKIGRNAVPQTVGIAVTLLIAAVGLRDYRAFMGEEEYKIRLMAETEAALSLIGPQDCVLYNFDQVQAVTGYYLPETVERYLWRGEGEKLIQEITSPCGTVQDAEEIRKMLAKTRTEGTESSVWFIGSFNSREDIAAEWRAAGLEVEERGSFLLERYWFNLYKIS